MKTIRLLILGFLLSFSLWGRAQDNLGIAGSNHAPTNTVLINPSSIVDSKAFIDINFAGFGVYAHNNFAYLTKESFHFRPGEWAANPPEVGQKLDWLKYYAVADVNIHGPSATFHVKKNAFGIYTGLRSVSDARRIPADMVNFAVYGWDYEYQIQRLLQMKNVRATSLNWAEFGLTYARIISQKGSDLWTGGISVKRLIGIGGGGLRLDRWNYEVADSSLTSYDLSGRYGFNDPAWNSGSGWGVDLGVTFKKTMTDVGTYTPFSQAASCTTSDYKYKLAFALLDIGRIAFDPPFYANELTFTDSTTWSNFTNINSNTAEGLNGEIENGLGQSGTIAKSSHKVWLPTAFNFQYDYNFGRNFYLNTIFIAGLPWKRTLGVQRGAQWAVIPRYELKNFEFSLPFIMHEWKYPSLGAMVRLRSIIIGTDRLGAYLFNQDVYGADLYVNVKYTLFKSFKCSKGSSSRSLVPRSKTRGARLRGKFHRKKRKGALPCPSW